VKVYCFCVFLIEADIAAAYHRWDMDDESMTHVVWRREAAAGGLRRRRWRRQAAAGGRRWRRWRREAAAGGRRWRREAAADNKSALALLRLWC
jgi:hypothetical protein